MKFENISERSIKDLCAAITIQAIDDYDRLLYMYFKHAQDPKTQKLIPFSEFDYFKALNNKYKSKRQEIEISNVEPFFDSEWFSLIIGTVGDYHPDQIKTARRKIIAKRAVTDKILTPHKVFEIFKMNGWEGSPY